MSPYLHQEFARARQQEIARRATNSHRSDAARTTVKPRRSIKHRVGQGVAALGVCVVAGTAVAASGAHSNPRPMSQHSGHISAGELAREIRAFEAKGYVPASCTVSGTLMRNYSTGQSVTVKW